jgi:hypothetical protein
MQNQKECLWKIMYVRNGPSTRGRELFLDEVSPAVTEILVTEWDSLVF